MNIQTMSIVVPTKGCVNSCKFCVSKMHTNDYELQNADTFSYKKALIKRLKYAQLHNVDTIILTGTGEALQNMRFLEMFSDALLMLNNPFPRIEIQTTGVLLTYDTLKFLRELGVSTISLSVSDLFHDERNMEIIGTPSKLQFKLDELTKLILSFDFNIRLSLNMTNVYNYKTPSDFFTKAKELGASQITFRQMYSSNGDAPEDKWVNENQIKDGIFDYLIDYIKEHGTMLYRLPFGSMVYSVNELGTVIDDDCMNTKKADESLKYLILRENGKLYTHWSDKGSLIF